jgi:hypothetical protein
MTDTQNNHTQITEEEYIKWIADYANLFVESHEIEAELEERMMNINMENLIVSIPILYHLIKTNDKKNSHLNKVYSRFITLHQEQITSLINKVKMSEKDRQDIEDELTEMSEVLAALNNIHMNEAETLEKLR